ncbi:MAG: c-type cytochrome [Anaerolineae bacterium]
MRIHIAHGLVTAFFVLLAAGALYILFGFFLDVRSSLATPSPMQIGLAEMGKNFLVPGDVAKLSNPVPSSPEVLEAARRNYNSRCAVCHGNDGKAGTATGANTYPPAADLTAARTQGKADGMLYWIIQNGLPHTAMPGWQKVLKDDEIWGLVAYARQLPKGVPVAEAAPAAPTSAPTTAPTIAPTAAPTLAPTVPPTTAPTAAPAAASAPTAAPTSAPPPTAAPTAASAPTVAPTSAPPPTAAPTAAQAAAAPKSNNVVTVRISDYAYQPDRITVPVGTTVVWANEDDEEHDVTSEGGTGVLNSPDFGQGGKFSFTFNQAGEYKYYCVPHDYMHGVVVVR